MGAYLSEPMIQKESEEGEANKIKYGACSMQGWRVSQEDAHNCVAEFDEKSSLFAVYDGHGGAEVAIYLSKHLPEVLKACAAYKDGEFVKALEECYLKIDESIKTQEVIREIQQIAKCNNSDNEATVDYEDENVGALYEEATMPLDKLVAKYQSGSAEESNAEEEDPDCKPGSSKAMAGGSSSSSSSRSRSRSIAFVAEVGQSSSSSSASTGPSSSSPSSASASKPVLNEKENGESEVGSSSDHACRSEPAEEKELKTEENGSAAAESSIELIVEGKKIELKEEDVDSKEADSVIPEESLPVKSVNGNSTPEKSDAGAERPKPSSENEDKPAVVNGSLKSDDVSSSTPGQGESSVAAADSSAASSSPVTPRRKKFHPVPVLVEKDVCRPERRSPRKSQLKSFNCSDSDESDDDDDAGFNVDDSDDSEDEEELEEEESSDDDEDDDEEDCEEEEDERFLSDVQEPGYDSGCTAVVCYMKWEADSLSVWVANAGDSRCVVCREGKAVDMSHDHKPESDAEAKRIVKAGGKVTEDGRVNGGLNLSRAIGDHSYKQNPSLPPEEQMISPLPSVEHIVLNPNKDKFIVLACDGIWNSMSSQEVIDFVGERLDKNEPLSKICEELFDACLAPDTCGDGTGCDNMTAIIVQLSDAPQAFSGSKRKFTSGDAVEGDSVEDPELAKKSRAE